MARLRPRAIWIAAERDIDECLALAKSYGVKK
jgi:hypothetical protein